MRNSENIGHSVLRTVRKLMHIVIIIIIINTIIIVFSSVLFVNVCIILYPLNLLSYDTG